MKGKKLLGRLNKDMERGGQNGHERMGFGVWNGIGQKGVKMVLGDKLATNPYGGYSLNNVLY